MKQRFLTALILLFVLALCSLVIIDFELSQPWHKQPLVSLRQGLWSEAHIVQVIYADGQSIGTFQVDPSLQKNYIITVTVEDGEERSVPRESRKILNVTFHTLGKAVESNVGTNTTTTTTPLPTTPRPNERHYLCPEFKGRLGNMLFIFASNFGFASQSNLSVVVPKNSSLWTLFTLDKGTSVSVTNDETPCKGKLSYIDSGVCCKYNPNLPGQVKGKGNVHIKGFLQSYRYFEGAAGSLKQALALTPEYQNKSSQALLKALLTRYNSSQQWQGRTFVGVHVRRGDFLSEKAARFGHVAAEKDYYARAMTYFESHFPNVTFVVCSDTLAWARANVRHNHSVVVDSGSELVDFAVLTRMNHTLMSTGSFSWWAAWLANGTAVYLGQFLKPGSSMATQFNPKGEDYVLPRWIPL